MRTIIIFVIVGSLAGCKLLDQPRDFTDVIVKVVCMIKKCKE